MLAMSSWLTARRRARHRTHLCDGLAGGADRVVRILQIARDVGFLQRPDQFERLVPAVRDQFVQRGIEAGILQIFRFARVEDGEPGIDSRCDRVFPENARAEAVNGRDVRRLELAQPERIVREQLRKLRLHVGSGLFGKGDREDVARFEPVIFDQRTVAFDQNGSFARPRSGHHASVLSAVFDRAFLLRGKFRHRGRPRPRRARSVQPGRRCGNRTSGIARFRRDAL